MEYKTYLILSWLWNLIIFVGFSYLIFFRGESGWWYLFMLIISSGGKSKKELEQGSEENV